MKDQKILWTSCTVQEYLKLKAPAEGMLCKAGRHRMNAPCILEVF